MQQVLTALIYVHISVVLCFPFPSPPDINETEEQENGDSTTNDTNNQNLSTREWFGCRRANVSWMRNNNSCGRFSRHDGRSRKIMSGVVDYVRQCVCRLLGRSGDWGFR